ncbi:helix-turn-helix domain-containing protein [Lactobacillus nasalidis]|uniref:helix-turn-helix domain-containing protein n=1 Tax=Lactobacillus nasalidis TaxID=2797258 RepID=UPI001914F467|nr:helix-turn-helix transcriptional regulator [Lactobacillus nasalidis]GHV97859.1 hypothetical protein lacNasYZ01_10410 [Lactobacillus nasalidis]GHW00089.1 hypothetical protein lacNasYZ02_15180 [Lactobacillus nasalidis]
MRHYGDDAPFLDVVYVRTWLRVNHVSARKLCEKAGIDSDLLSKWFHYHNKPSLTMARYLAEAMGVSVVDILVSPEEVPPSVRRADERRRQHKRAYARERRRKQ